MTSMTRQLGNIVQMWPLRPPPFYNGRFAAAPLPSADHAAAPAKATEHVVEVYRWTNVRSGSSSQGGSVVLSFMR